MTLPRRGPVSEAQRAKEIARTQAAGSSGYGQTPNARPVTAPSIASAQRLPQPGVIAGISATDPISSSSLPHTGSFDSSSMVGFGKYDGYIGLSGGVFVVLQAGWYQLTAQATVQGLKTGEFAFLSTSGIGSMYAGSPYAQVTGVDPTGATGLDLSVTSGPQYLAPADVPQTLSVQVDQIGSSTATVSALSAAVVRLGD